MNLSNDTYLISGSQQKIGRDGETLFSQTLARLHHLGAYWAEKRTKNREMRELFRFSDRELHDLGLSRSDVLAIDKGTYRRD